jgi:hypothetical protein
MEEMSSLGVNEKKERDGGEMADGEERRVGRERLGGRRWRRRESASAALEVERWLLVVVDGVGGGAEVAPP